MIESDKVLGQKFNFNDYLAAKTVMEDYPPLMSILNKLIPILREKSQYMAVYHLLQAAEESRLLISTQYEFYREVYKKKGKVDHG